jgi:hypothetical protein
VPAAAICYNKVGKRSKMAGETVAVEKLTLQQLEKQIVFMEWRTNGDINRQLRKEAFTQLIWLEAERERLHGIPAPERKFPR